MLVKEKKINYLISINNIEDINDFKKVGITTFLFPLKDYSIGYESYYTKDEINSINEEKYVLVNRLLNTKEIEEIKEILPKLKCKGIIFEDVGLINVLKDAPFEKILFMNHFNCNSYSINYNLEYVDSVFVSNELTYNEYKIITEKVNKKVILNVFGYNQIMYSKRKLLTNFNKEFNLKETYDNIIKDQNSDVKFKIIEQNDETIILSSKIFDGRRLLDLNNVKYFYINSSFISKEDIIKFINNEDVNGTDDGFLEKATIYKVKGERK